MKHSAKGMTLPELVIAISIVSVIALAVTGVAMALSTANANANAYDQTIQGTRVASMTLGSQMKSSSLVTACDSGRIALWTGDANNDGKINYDELAVISYEQDTEQLVCYRAVFPSNWPQWLKNLLNTPYELADLTSASTVESLVRYGFYSQQTVLANDVSSVGIAASPAPPMSKLATVEFTIGQGDSAMTSRATANLRADRTSSVMLAGDEYYLDPN